MAKKTLTLIFFLYISGCTFVDHETIGLSYNLQANISKIPEVHNLKVSVQVINSSGLKGKNRNTIGFKGNGSEIYANDVEEVLRQALVMELEARGIKTNNDATAIISAEVISLWNNFIPGWFSGKSVAVLKMNISIKNINEAPVYSRLLIGEGVLEDIHITSGDNARIALNMAIENGMKLLFNEQPFISAIYDLSKHIND